ncbi:MAG TPA: hypothetical protein VJ063_07990 [Verrucomicrobiae bacterium]|nr:hypothetical protein [Verrucomicrobiae bacterium]
MADPELKPPDQQPERNETANDGNSAPGSKSRQAPPHDPTGNDPNDDADTGEVYKGYQ